MPKLKTLRGKRIILNFPSIDKPKIIELSPEAQEDLDRAMMKKFTSLEVYAVGADVSEGINIGDKVYVLANALQGAERIDIDGEVRMMISEYDISLVWE